MHILLIADGRSPTARRWIQGVLAIGHQVTLVSSYPCEAVPGVLAQHCLPVAFASLAGSQAGRGESSRGAGQPAGRPDDRRKWISRARRVFLAGRYWLGPLTLGRYARELHKLLADIRPDLVHALRIPYEGMLAVAAEPEVPLVVTIWGNDLTLHAPTTAVMRAWTRRTLQRANGLLADTRRDLRLAGLWGFPSGRPQEVIPGNGGIDRVEMDRVHSSHTGTFANVLPAGVPLVVNSRGLRPAYVRNDIFFQAIPLVYQYRKDVVFVCTSMQDQPEALQWMQRLNLNSHQVRLLPYLPQSQMWELFQRAEISASISTHDGTPNTLLEAMSSACFPVVGDLEALREWITPGVNGLVVEPSKPQAVAEALLLALDHPELRARAAEINQRLVTERAEIGVMRARLAEFYRNVVSQ